MHAGFLTLCRQIFLLQCCYFIFAAACTVVKKELSWQMSPVNQFSRIDLNSSLANVISTAGTVSGMFSSGALPVESFGSLTKECPSECLTTLTAYTDTKQGTFVMLRPGDINSFVNYTPLKADALLCAPSEGYCGADKPVYLVYSDLLRDYYIAFQPTAASTYVVQNSGKPLCYVWTSTSSSTTTTTLATSAMLNGTTTTSATLFDNSTTLSVFDNSTTTTVPLLSNDTTTTSLFTNSSDNSTTTPFNFTTTTPNNVNYTTTTLPGNLTSVFTTTTVTFPITVPGGNATTSGITTTTATSLSSTTTILSSTDTSTDTSTTTKSYKKKKALSIWPLILAGFVGLGVLVITLLALSTLSIIRSGKRALVQPMKTTSPPPPYPYHQDPNSELPPQPVTAMAAPQTFTLNAPPSAEIPLHTMPNIYG
ncbi:unnamed protein product [Cylicocyclus nassatus]|uniref:Uncharacterized protein n=1 Tax=Cylicocyclus nassatus TaxID=53992 RepID=A0AA36DNW2_CYLNA|nr:unnamed protein product [Cylicocyclus nassatus]